MKSIHIRNVPEDTLAALKRLARTRKRSLQGELHWILEEAARRAPGDHNTGLDSLVKVKAGGGSWRREEIYVGSEGR